MKIQGFAGDSLWNTAGVNIPITHRRGDAGGRRRLAEGGTLLGDLHKLL